MREELKDFLRLVLVAVIVAVIEAVGQIYDIFLFKAIGNSIAATAYSIYGYRNGQRNSRKDKEDEQ